MIKTLTFILLITFVTLDSQEFKTYSFQNLPEKLEKPILIYMKTTWCSVCKIQMRQIENDPELKKFFNDKVYFTIFDTEKSKDTINFLGQSYQYIPNGNSGIHELALALSRNQQPIYPTWILMDSDFKVLFYQQGLTDNAILRMQIIKPFE